MVINSIFHNKKEFTDKAIFLHTLNLPDGSCFWESNNRNQSINLWAKEAPLIKFRAS